MPTYLLTSPDGKKYKVTAPDQDSALNAFRKQMGGAAPAAAPNPALGMDADISGMLPDAKSGPAATVSKSQARGFGLADTLGFGFSDEIGSGIGSVVEKLGGDQRPIGDIYRDILTRGRGLDKASQEAFPLDYFGGQAVGAVATLPIGGAGLRGAKGVLDTVKAGAKTGAAFGGLYGFGSGEGGFEQRVNSAAKGSLTGGLVGGALPLAASGVQGAYRAFRPAIEPTNKFAARKVVQAAERAGTTIPNAMQEVSRLGMANPDVVLADALGKSGQRLARAVVNKGGAGAEEMTQRLGQRQAGQGERAVSAVSRGLGDPESFYGNLDRAITALKTNAKPIYDAAYSKPIDYARFGNDLDAAFNRIPKRIQGQVVSAANDLMQMEGVQSRQIMARINADGSVTFERLPDVRQWDYIKRGIDKIIEGQEGQAASGGMSQFGRVLGQVKNDLLGTLDRAVPEFKMARKVFSDDLSVKNALEQGRKAINLDPELIVKSIRDMDAAAREMYRAGFARAIGDQIGRVRYGNDAINRIWNTPSQQKRLKAVFGSKKEFERFADFAKGEQRMAETWKAVSGNSTSAQQINDMIDAGNPVVDMAAQAATGGWKSALVNAVMRWGRTLGGLTEARADEIARLLMSKGMTPELQQAIQRQELTDRQKQMLLQLIYPASALSAANSQTAPQQTPTR